MFNIVGNEESNRFGSLLRHYQIVLNGHLNKLLQRSFLLGIVLRILKMFLLSTPNIVNILHPTCLFVMDCDENVSTDGGTEDISPGRDQTASVHGVRGCADIAFLLETLANNF